MKNKLLVICGPTAVGKTKLGIELVRKFEGEILSADSRQVYRGMDIGTGKDKPQNGIKLWGIDLVDPKEKFSVAQYCEEGSRVISKILEREHLPIVVGGTGLYVKALVDGIDTAQIKPDFLLRRKLAKLSVDELYEKLIKINSIKAASMNESDRKNPRRLIRAIEIAKARIKGNEKKSDETEKYDVLMVGLMMNRDDLYKKIETRVDERIKQGVIAEIEGLLIDGVSWDDQAMEGLGYRQLRGYFENEMSLEDAIQEWKKEEKRYAKRQMSWFKRDSRIEWFDVSEEDYEAKVEEKVRKWYSQIN